MKAYFDLHRDVPALWELELLRQLDGVAMESLAKEAETAPKRGRK